jgi:hypothetical protein
VRSHAKAASVLAFLATLFAALAPVASAAPTATTTYAYATSFGSDLGAFEYPEQEANGIVLDGESGNIYVAKENAHEVEIYAPDPSLGGSLLTQVTVSGYPTNLALDQETKALYAQESIFIFSGGMQRYLSDGASPPSYTLDPTFTPAASPGFLGDFKKGIVVDPTSHELLALDLSRTEIERLDSTGAVLSSFLLESKATMIAVGLDGTIYSAGWPTEGGPQGIERHTPTGTLLPSLKLPGTDGAKGLGVDPNTGNLVVAAAGRVLVFTPSGEKLFDGQLQGVGSQGMAIDLERERIYNLNPSTHSIDTYIPAVSPGIEKPTFSDLTTTGFHVEAEVDPGEKEGAVPDESSMRFEYRLVGEENWTPTPDQAVTAAGTFGADVTGLDPNFTYEVRVVARNSLVTHTADPVKVTTVGLPPETETGAATDVTETRAVLNGTINAMGLQTTYYFEYGTTTAYGSRIPVAIEAVAGGGRVVKAFSRTITGLAAGTTYHFRLVATNSVGTTEGQDRTFATVAAGGIPRRAYEQVTPPDKGGVAISPNIGMQASADGEAISFVKRAGSQSSAITVRGLARRGANDWRGDIDLDPPFNLGTENFLVHPSLAISEDFTHTLVASSRALAPGAIENGGNLYRVDLASGAYEFIGGSSAPRAFDSFAGALSAGTFQAGAPDFSWIVFVSPKPLLPDAPNSALYRWSETNGLEVVSILPNGEMTAAVRADVSPLYDTVSADGSRIYFTAVNGSEEGVFLREEGGPAKPVSVSHIPGDPATPQQAILLGTNEDGRYAFFTSVANSSRAHREKTLRAQKVTSIATTPPTAVSNTLEQRLSPR